MIRADVEWYTSQSHQNHVPPRCPYASVHRCPRYYQSIWLLGQYGGATQIDPEADKSLIERWNSSDLWPATREQETSIFGPDNRPTMFNRFCPEASFEHFGLFATDLYRYSDDIDLDSAHANLARHGTGGNDWRWTWETIHPMHYTECPLYSLLLHASHTSAAQGSSGTAEPDKIMDFRPTFHGISVDVNLLLRRALGWWARAIPRWLSKRHKA